MYEEKLQKIINEIKDLYYLKWNVNERNKIIEAKKLIESLL